MAEHICLICGYEGLPRKTKRGSRGMEIFVWAVLLIPGPLYSLWRRIGLSKQCPNCSAPKMVPVTSDAGQVKQRQMDAELGLTIQYPTTEGLVISDRSHSTAAPAQARQARAIDPDAW